MKLNSIIGAGMLMLGGLTVAAAVSAPSELLTEHLSVPLGVNTTTPRFSWKNNVADVKAQQAYEILVGTDSLALARKGAADLWKSGKVASTASTLVEYAGTPLLPRTQAWWKVRVWNENGKASQWSDVARFGVGVVAEAETPLQGKYIGMPSDAGLDLRSPLLRNTLEVPANHGRIMAHVNSLGYHELYVNGRKAGKNVLSPGVSQLGKRSLVVTYDITDLVADGKNDILLWLGQGWFKPTTFKAPYGGPVAKIEIDNVKGSDADILLSGDKSWKAAESGRHDTGSWNALSFGGEKVDGRVAPASLASADLDRLKWIAAAEVEIPAQQATPEASGNNTVVSSFPAVSVTPLPDGTYMADMGRVLTGWLEMRMPKLAAGTEVTMEYSDNLTPAGEFDPQGEADIYVAAGRDGETFTNKFNHHAYRYVKVKGLSEAPSADMFTARQIHGEYADASTFRCSDPDLNAIHDMIKYTMQCLTFSGYMVDCPHLERTGYGGDGNSSTLVLQTMYDVAPTYTNWMQAWGDVIDPDGSLPHVAPAGGGGGGPYWCAFIVLAPWRTWLNYGDRRMLETYYPLMKQWMGYVDAYIRDGLLHRWPDTHNRVWYLGDWLAPAGVDAGNPSSVDLVNNCVISDCLDKMERIANELSLPDEAAQWRNRRMALNAAIHYNFYDAEKQQYATGSQLDMSYPMLVGAVPEHLRGTVAKRLLELSATDYRGHIGAGLVGVPIITQWAIDEHQPDFMASMLRHRDYPGYLYMIDNGATATWEYWNGERSRVHNCYNGIGLWFYQGVGGIVPDPDAVAYSHFIIDPQMPSGVDWAETTKETPRGTVAVKWSRTPGGDVEYALSIPEGSTATVKVPAGMTAVSTPANGDSLTLAAGNHTLRFSARQ